MHPNVVATRNADWVEGRFVLATDLAKTNLDAYPAARRSAAVALRVIRDAARGLAHAHAQRIMHRDVKPENVVLSAQGAVLLDFGIARAIEAAGTAQLTRSGIAVGTSHYMSPEQVQAVHDIDHRSDLYSVGCLLYESLAGHAPFRHPNEVVVLQMHLIEVAPDLRGVRPAAPEPMVAVIERAMEKNRDARWQTAAEMMDALAPAAAPR